LSLVFAEIKQFRTQSKKKTGVYAWLVFYCFYEIKVATSPAQPSLFLQIIPK
jgi:hypothetical protein